MEGDRGTTRIPAVAPAALIVGFIVGLIVAWLYWLKWTRRRARGQWDAVRALELELEPVAVRRRGEGPYSAAPQFQPDDFQRIEGMGPKFSSMLLSAGIESLAQLAATDVDDLRRILRAEGLHFADPTTWPEQARLASAGAWNALEKLQDELTAGRRT
jgi:predicted flap endonuclease-1-like 5' DNA nuclease